MMESDVPSETKSAEMKTRVSFKDGATSGPSHIIMYNDGSKDVFALSLTKDMVDEHQAILGYGELKNEMESKLQLVREELSASKSQVSRSGYTEEEPLRVEHPMLTKAHTRNDKLQHDILAMDLKIKRLRSQFREGVEEGFTKAVMQILSLTKNRRTIYSKLILPEIYFTAMSKRRRETRRISSRDMAIGRNTKTRGHGCLILCRTDSGAFIETWEVSSPSSALPNLFEVRKVPDNWHVRQPTLENPDCGAAVKNDVDEAETDGGHRRLAMDEKST